MATPVTFPTPKIIIGFNKETSQGAGVVTTPTFSLPVNSFTPEPKFTWLDDTAMDQSMGDIRSRTQGVQVEDISFAGPAYMDILPLLLNNILGDITSAGTAPTTHAISTLNSGGAQPGSLTLISYQGMPATSAQRYYPGVCLSELTLSGNAESTLIMYEAKGASWPSADMSSAVTFTPTAVAPQAAWRYALGLGGAASGGTQVKTVRDWSITITRALRPEFTLQNSQNPFIIQRGLVGVTGALTCTVPADESFYTYLLANTQPQLQLLGLIGSGATAYGLQIDMQTAAFDTNALKTDEEALGYNGTIVGVKNTTNAGASGGTSAIKVTVTNQTAAGAY
jgi:hypothetical protein